MARKTLTSAIVIGTLALWGSGPVNAGHSRSRSAPRHMSLNTEQVAATGVAMPFSAGTDFGTQIAMKIQDDHHGEGGN